MTRTLPNAFQAASAPVFSTVFIDFDGTIADNDVTDTLLERFAAPEWQKIENEWLSGKIGSRECMMQQIALLNASPADLVQCLDEMKIDPAFADFIHMLEHDDIDVSIVSDGLDFSIRSILQRYGLGHIKILANRLLYCGNSRWQLQFPYKNTACPAGNCKCRHFANIKNGFTLYIGDGTSDFARLKKPIWYWRKENSPIIAPLMALTILPSIILPT
ncbi:MtnX-like HAD-IB family phosphatase [uncultured Bartonella sp.]|uniref:MtnX-like HAD-IB family phosphatase n=1 Tax=uncultured Bartonella sp. TaxID=104108 RepID=UPI0026118C6F|nr:MtnX-like HAD-IB family phosphatase [uncultured Bartonella sp.]